MIKQQTQNRRWKGFNRWAWHSTNWQNSTDL